METSLDVLSLAASMVETTGKSGMTLIGEAIDYFFRSCCSLPLRAARVPSYASLRLYVKKIGSDR